VFVGSVDYYYYASSTNHRNVYVCALFLIEIPLVILIFDLRNGFRRKYVSSQLSYYENVRNNCDGSDIHLGPAFQQ
jgi:hypothetical protein